MLLLRCSSLYATPVLKRNCQEQRAYDRDRYHARHLIAHFFCTLKQYRAIATRDDKTARNSLAAVSLTSTVITLNRGHPPRPRIVSIVYSNERAFCKYTPT